MCAVGVADADGRTAAALLPSEGVVLRGEETLRTPLDMVSASHYQVLVILHRGQVRLQRLNLPPGPGLGAMAAGAIFRLIQQ